MSEEQENQPQDSEPTFEVDKNDFSKHWQYLKKRENLLMGTLWSIGAAFLILMVWLAIMKITGHPEKIGWMTLAEGFGIGFTMQHFGKGVSPLFGVIGGILAFCSWISGNFLTGALIFAHVKHVSFIALVSHANFSTASILLKVIGPIDYLLCAGAVYAAYYFGFKRVVPDNIK